MTDYAERITITRPRTRPIDRIIDAVNRLTPYILAAIIGAVIGLAQGALQSNAHWTDKIVERSTVDPSGIAMPVYEDVEGNVYYSHMERRIK